MTKGFPIVLVLFFVVVVVVVVAVVFSHLLNYFIKF